MLRGILPCIEMDPVVLKNIRRCVVTRQSEHKNHGRRFAAVFSKPKAENKSLGGKYQITKSTGGEGGIKIHRLCFAINNGKFLL
jgi:hypothetical protein